MVKFFRSIYCAIIILVFGFPVIGTLIAQDTDPSVLSLYKQAQYFLNQNESRIYEAYISPNWVENGNLFWYKKEGVDKTEYILVNPASRTKALLFNHGKLASALEELLAEEVAEDSLALSDLKYDHSENKIAFKVKDHSFEYQIEANQLDSIASPELIPNTEVLSPDGQYLAFVKDHNLWVRDIHSGEEIQLTFDGEKHFAYATPSEANLRFVTDTREKTPFSPIVEWSPDSRRILTHRIDEREVKSSHLLQMVGTDASLRPKLYTFKYPVPGDSIIPLAYPVVIEVANQKTNWIKVPGFAASPNSPLFAQRKRFWWKDSVQIELLWEDRYRQELRFYLVNAEDGAAELLVKEHGRSLMTANAFIFNPPNIRHMKTEEFIWFSERSGYGHLYLYGADKKLKNPITEGNYLVRDIIWLDESKRQVYFSATGKEPDRDPYFRHLYRVDLDGRNLKLLTPDNADHKIKLSPNHSYMVVNEAWNGLPRSILRDLDGNFIMALEESNVEAWIQKGWQLPERVRMVAADGITPIYGVIFSPAKIYGSDKVPIIDDVYPGPQINRVSYVGTEDRPILNALRHPSALNQLGFVVVQIDGRGTPFRSKAFFDYSYNDLGVAGGLIDHVEGIKQLANRYPFIDTSRVGIFGHSGGGYASVRAILGFPEFYDVAVSSAGNHDTRGYHTIWMDLYMNAREKQTTPTEEIASLVHHLKGKLLLMTGDLDDNVHPTMTINLIDALIKANKSFDFLLLPNANHGSVASPYFLKRRWDYFYEHLLGKTPPIDFELKLR